MQEGQRKLRWATHQQRWFGKWHVYLGIIAGLIVAIVGITGSILVFEDEIDRALNPSLFHVAESGRRLTPDQLVPLLLQQAPAIHMDYIYEPEDHPSDPFMIYDYSSEQQYFVNPYTGRLIGQRSYESGFIHEVTEIHRTLLVPVAGRYIVGLSSLILLILTISGLRLWIPAKWSQLKSMLTVNFKASFKRQNYDWHNVTGFYSAPVVSLLSLTGFCITFSIIVIPLLFLLSGRSPQGAAQVLGATSTYTKGAQQLPLSKVLAISREIFPDSKIAGIALPADSTGNFRMDLASKGLPRSGKREMLILDQYSGKVLLNSRTDFPPVANAYLSWLVPLHLGTFGGLPTRILALIAGLIPAVLFVTGFIIWYPRWKKQRNKRTKAAAVVTVEEEEDDAEVATVVYKKRGTAVHKTALALPVTTFFWVSAKKGMVYALWFVLAGAVLGALYGAVSGIILQPAVFTIAFCTTLVAANFVIALLTFIVNGIFLAPFKKGSRAVVKYFSLSLGFFVVFMVTYFLLMNTGIKIF
jgi:uncharacterized iron-regulated membrane protein